MLIFNEPINEYLDISNDKYTMILARSKQLLSIGNITKGYFIGSIIENNFSTKQGDCILFWEIIYFESISFNVCFIYH